MVYYFSRSQARKPANERVRKEIAMRNAFRMPGSPAEAEIVEKKSRFIAAVMPVTAEADALAFLRERRELYPDARHHVYAYVVDSEDGTYTRYSDDGEPQGTGGLPVLGIIRKRGLSNLAVVVTRYFGGILLGAPGLTRAYASSAAACLDNSGVAEMRWCREFAVTSEYTDSGRVRNWLSAESAAEHGWEASDEATEQEQTGGDPAARAANFLVAPPEYSDKVRFSVWVPVTLEDAFVRKLTDATNSRAQIEPLEREYRKLN